MAFGLPSERRLRRWSNKHRAVLVVAAAILVAAAFVALLWRGAPWLDASRLRGLTPVQRETAIDAIRGRLLQLGAGLVIAAGLVYTGLTFRLNREGQVTDRYTKAIDQLGSERLDVRLGAIYALERIMIDSARDHPTIVEVLAAYIREHAPRKDLTAASRRKQLVAGLTRVEEPEIPLLATDVQAALTVLGRRPYGRHERGPVNLARTDLTRADLPRGDLHGAVLTGANLTGANLIRANLAGVWLTDADLTKAFLTGAVLTGAHMTSARLTGAALVGADLAIANLAEADLTDADLHSADLHRAYLIRAKLIRANLNRVDLTDADLLDADMTDADLLDAKVLTVRSEPSPPGP